ncbi:MAG TPA: hypothetical protein G4O06_08255 [Dehalococcoidia bacterium]|nr:hypothetical protein [Dehalococcoidia bacterium]
MCFYSIISDYDFADEIYVVDADGSNRVNLSNNPGNDSMPAWSPQAVM